MIIDPQGECLPQTRQGTIEHWRFRLEKNHEKELRTTIQLNNGDFVVTKKKVRQKSNLKNNYFEKKWPNFLLGDIYS